MFDRKFSAPTSANLEITEKCNARCLHCYNPWREEHMGVNSFTIKKVKKTMDKLKEAGVFHIVFTGGEPMAKMDVLIEALKYGNSLGFSFSCNSNLMLTTDKKMKELSLLGLDHILTSFPSIDPNENDKIMKVKNSVYKIEKGIVNAINNNIRVSVNMVITKFNFKNVYNTGKYVADLGCTKFLVTRAVPPVYSYENTKPKVPNEYKLSHKETKFALDQALKVREETGIQLGTLVNYPVCFLEDLEKYKDFFGRGCPSQRGHRLNINATGDMHVCVHEETAYGNINKDDLKEVYKTKMNFWHDKKKMIYDGCKGCEYIPVCYSGCQMIALAFNGKFGTKDPLYAGPNKVSKKYFIQSKTFKEIENLLDQKNAEIKISQSLRFREEKDFFLVNIQWANTISLNKNLGTFIKNNINTKLKVKNIHFPKPLIVFLILKNVFILKNYQLSKDLINMGLSANIENLPYFSNLDTNEI